LEPFSFEQGAWLRAFAVTELVEAPLYALALLRGPLGTRESKPRRWNMARAIVLALCASAITHPLAWFVLAPRRDPSSWPAVAFAEVVVVVIESGYLASLGLRRAIVWSLCANAVSFGVGLCLGAIGL
jgi:hypothetical protein